MSQRQKQRVAKVQTDANLKKLSKFELFSETWKYEVEIVSNRKIVSYGEYFTNFAHTAHHAREVIGAGSI